MASVQHSQEEIREMIAAMITTPNKPWTKRKKNKQNTAFPETTLANMHEYCMNRYVETGVFIKSATFLPALFVHTRPSYFLLLSNYFYKL